MDEAIGRDVLRCDYYDVGLSARYVTLSGEADLANADQLERDLRRLMADSWVTRLDLDLTALRHLGCAALAALLAVREADSARGQEVVVIAAAVAPARVLALSAAGEPFDYPPAPGHDRQVGSVSTPQSLDTWLVSLSGGGAGGAISANDWR
ncbi:STAS domain-containing protein [Micromonospora chersina]|uniref:STAS domain-containing protein n=1 Tax=Micromonospora chersina TaxID=47854 RepID=UPI003D8A0939